MKLEVTRYVNAELLIRHKDPDTYKAEMKELAAWAIARKMIDNDLVRIEHRYDGIRCANVYKFTTNVLTDKQFSDLVQKEVDGILSSTFTSIP